jgi:DNA-binding response OmpR family regulator
MTITSHVVVLGEPDRATREIYQRALCDAFEVIPAPDEHTVLNVLYTRQIRALVLEPMIFSDRGWEQLAVVSRACTERGIALIVCSTLDERRRGIELGAAAYLVKPTLPATLLGNVRQVIGREGAEHGGAATERTG